MRRRWLIALSALALLAGAACGDDNGGNTPGGSFRDPSGLPDDFPAYAGSDFTNGDDDAGAFVGVWETDDDPEQVRDALAEQLRDGPWRIVEETEEDGSIVIRVERDGDAPAGEPDEGTIVIREEGGVTSIVKEAKRKDSVDATPQPDATEPPNPDPDETPIVGSLPPGYPTTLAPLPDDAEIGITSVDDDGIRAIYQVRVSTGSSPDEVVSFYEDAFAEQGWTENLVRNENGTFLVNYTNGANSVNVAGSGDETASEVDITLTVAE